MSTPPFIVFSDLDGTLLDHEDYSWGAALPALAQLRGLGVPVVLASSKTAAEIARLRADMRLAHCPAIVENGAGLLGPRETPLERGDDYIRLRACLDAVPGRLRNHFVGFGDWDTSEVALQTGLPPEQARLAKQRAFSEPGLWSGTAEERDAFLDALAEQGVSARRGGRFLTLSFGGTKADRMAEVVRQYSGDGAASLRTIALGDAPNDVEMLEAADYGVVIENPASPEMPTLAGERAGRIRRSTKPGPAGWNETILALVSELAGN
ncbi:mannosyl-3-phosphoglycerate phosphatase [Oceanicola sp. 22II-s10i]|uniref:HAD-IIB family hydrolase n=1 Tax=Oceanicola sp. 22II-s10i TaxID=1317116 RepID=UPI000B527783|nr:HAD-IIB family hydrolase [Oceanicola sp. 22II-s10i]OWU84457.1 mannosyl-3-phosphoglycerate phosphatase [Oceanicola sp. 22II-s10i]